MTNQPDTDDPVIRPFADWLREQSKGTTHEELSERLHTLIGRVRDTGKKGALQLTITVSPFKGDSDALLVADSIKLTLPQHDRKDSIFYADKAGNFSREDPQQLPFEPLRQVGDPVADDDKGAGAVAK